MADKKQPQNPVEETEVSGAVAVLGEDTAIAMSKRQDVVESASTLAELKAAFGNQTLDWEDIEPSFKVADKADFDGIPFVLAGFRLNESTKYGRREEVNGEEVLVPGKFVSMLVAPYDDEGNIGSWVILNDGGTGIKAQLDRFINKVNSDAHLTTTEWNLTAAEIPPILMSNGLRVSEYDYDDGKNVTRASTWYIA